MHKKLLPIVIVITGRQTCQGGSAPAAILEEADNLLMGSMDVVANPVFKAFLAGSLSGTCSTVLFQPLDLVKTRIQDARGAGDTQGTREVRAPGMFQVARQVLATENVAGLWRGILPSVTRTVPGVGIYFGSLHWLKTTVGEERPNPVQAISLGVGARSFAATVMIPFTVLKARFESGQFKHTRMSTALVYIYKSEGVRGLTRGLLPTLARDAPYSGLYLMFYTQLKQQFIPRCQTLAVLDARDSAFVHFCCGIVAGFLSSLVTHPADVVKTKMQVRPEVFSSISKTVRLVVVRGGPKGLLVGFAPRMLRRALMSACAWTIYEEITKKLGLK